MKALGFGVVTVVLVAGCSDARARVRTDSVARREVAQPVSTADTTIYLESIVDRRADTKPPLVRPRYPEELRKQNMEGTVRARFVVDTTGLAEMNTLRLSGSHRYFEDAVREAFPRMRFLPAELHGHKVRQWVEMPFEFSLASR